MRMPKWLALVMVALVMVACASAKEMSAAGKSAQDAFQDAEVVSLLQAVRDGDLSKAKLLIAQGANVNAYGYEGVTPLIWMLYQRDDRAMGILLDLGGNPNQPMGNGGETPVWFAASGGHLQALKLLLSYGGDPNSLGRRTAAITIAMENNHMDCAELLLRRGANINWHVDFNSAIDAPLDNGLFEQVIWLLDHGYTYNLAAARRGVVNIVPSKDQEIWRDRALKAINKRISELKMSSK